MTEEELQEHQTNLMKDGKKHNEDDPINFLKYIKPFKFDRKIPMSDIN